VYRIRFHGRGGQGIRTAARILGTAFFLEGYEVQDAPRYGAERRGAPLFAYVRASRALINERGVIGRPDLIAVADESLVPVPAAGVLTGAQPYTVLLIITDEQAATWTERLGFPGTVLTLPSTVGSSASCLSHLPGACCAGASAQLTGAIRRSTLEAAIWEEILPLGKQAVEDTIAAAVSSFDRLSGQASSVREQEEARADACGHPDWITLPLEDVSASAPAIHAAATSVMVKTGLWRTLRPVLHRDRCRRCTWLCSTFCPDSAIRVDREGYPEIDYDHCKGCMICLAQCARHAIDAVAEHAAQTGGQA